MGVGLGLALLLLQLEEEFAVILDAADRRLGIRRDLDEIEASGLGLHHGIGDRDNADLGPVLINQADGRNSNLIIDARPVCSFG